MVFISKIFLINTNKHVRDSDCYYYLMFDTQFFYQRKLITILSTKKYISISKTC